MPPEGVVASLELAPGWPAVSVLAPVVPAVSAPDGEVFIVEVPSVGIFSVPDGIA